MPQQMKQALTALTQNQLGARLLSKLMRIYLYLHGHTAEQFKKQVIAAKSMACS